MTPAGNDDFEMVALEVLVVGETDLAVAVRPARPSGSPCVAWLPRQLVEMGPEASDGTVLLTLRRGLARARGLVR